eukprot:403367642
MEQRKQEDQKSSGRTPRPDRFLQPVKDIKNFSSVLHSQQSLTKNLNPRIRLKQGHLSKPLRRKLASQDSRIEQYRNFYQQQSQSGINSKRNQNQNLIVEDQQIKEIDEQVNSNTKRRVQGFKYSVPDFGFNDNKLYEELCEIDNDQNSSLWRFFYDSVKKYPKFERLENYIKEVKQQKLLKKEESSQVLKKQNNNDPNQSYGGSSKPQRPKQTVNWSMDVIRQSSQSNDPTGLMQAIDNQSQRQNLSGNELKLLETKRIMNEMHEQFLSPKNSQHQSIQSPTVQFRRPSSVQMNSQKQIKQIKNMLKQLEELAEELFSYCIETLVNFIKLLKEHAVAEPSKKKKKYLINRLYVYKYCLQILKDQRQFDLVESKLFNTFVENEFLILKQFVYPLLKNLQKYFQVTNKLENHSYCQVIYKNLLKFKVKQTDDNIMNESILNPNQSIKSIQNYGNIDIEKQRPMSQKIDIRYPTLDLGKNGDTIQIKSGDISQDDDICNIHIPQSSKSLEQARKSEIKKIEILKLTEQPRN